MKNYVIAFIPSKLKNAEHDIISSVFGTDKNTAGNSENTNIVLSRLIGSILSCLKSKHLRKTGNLHPFIVDYEVDWDYLAVTAALQGYTGVHFITAFDSRIVEELEKEIAVIENEQLIILTESLKTTLVTNSQKYGVVKALRNVDLVKSFQKQINSSIHKKINNIYLKYSNHPSVLLNSRFLDFDTEIFEAKESQNRKI